MNPRFTNLLVVIVFVAALIGIAVPASESSDKLQFNRDIRPILSDACFQCHGPDANQRKGDLRLDVGSQLFEDRNGHRVLVPNDPGKSELFRRVTSTDPDEQMPPPNSGRKLSAEQVTTLKKWVEQGADFEGHWAFIRPKFIVPPLGGRDNAVSPPQGGTTNKRTTNNPIDPFILTSLDREGLSPSPLTDKATLLRRVTLDLTGLPPSIDAVEEFLNDHEPDAFERVVDRLLASPRFGERFARPWLDGARYADTSGYQSDGERMMWRWRDWVIDAFNADKPFDEFTVEQLAGDVLPNATLDQVLATGFNRNHRGNAEGGIIPEEYAVEYVVDRVDTTATVWLGLTLGCCRCHDHKFDPFTQREYYQLFAFFNNVPERGRAIKFGNSPPFVKTPTRDQQRELGLLDERIHAAEKRVAELEPLARRAESDWLSAGAKQAPNWTVTRGLMLHLPLDADGKPAALPHSEQTIAAKSGAKSQPQPLGPTSGPAVVNEADRAEVVLGEGRFGKGAAFDGQRRFAVGDLANIGFYEPFSIAAWIRTDAESGTIVSRMSDDANSDGYNLCLENGKLQFNLAKRWLDDALRVATVDLVPLGKWIHVAVSYDGSRTADGVRFFVNGQPARKKVILDELNQAFASKDVFRLGWGGFTPPFRGTIDEVRVFAARLTDDEVAVLAVPESVAEIAALDADKRSADQSRKVRTAFLVEHAPLDIRNAHATLTELRLERERFVETFPTTMVMQELPEPRPAHLLQRGAYDRPGDRVSPGFPETLRLDKATNSASNREALARWLVSPDNPLTARVAVNRFWQQLFGNGIVKTVDDFGSQGDWPSHPDLLDWLAIEFARPDDIPEPVADRRHSVPQAWSIKRLVRQLVSSATYQQTSKASAELLARDPENRLLARGPRARLSAEMVRDQALAASGLLTEQLGGPSIKPYQPDGLWDDLQNTEKYVQDHGPALYRRGLYVFWKRTIAPPVMVTFDAAARETCFVRETRTNTPLQALALLNEPSFVEAARVIAERVLRSTSSDTDARLRLAFRLILTRQPTDRELTVLRRGLDQHLTRYRQSPDEAKRLLEIGESPADTHFASTDIAAWTAVCGLILNLDEAVTKE